MKLKRNNKGITLVSLIITIVILLILAAITIKAVKNDGIVTHAKNTMNLYMAKSEEENKLLQNYLKQLKKEINSNQDTDGVWEQEKNKVIRGKVTLEVGDTITNFNAKGYTWQVLGAENGKLLLTTSTSVYDNFYLSNGDIGWNETEKRFVKEEEALNNECKEIIKLNDEEKEIVEELRSIKVEDINRITGYNPEKTGNGKAYGAGQIYQYGNEVTYSVVKDENGTVTGVKYDSKNVTAKSGTSKTYKTFMTPKSSTDITSEYTVKSNFYYYYPASLTTDEPETEDINNIAYVLLFRNAENTKNVNYWLASSYVEAREGYVRFGMHFVDSGYVDGNDLWNSSYGEDSSKYGVRPVVSLSNSFKPVK